MKIAIRMDDISPAMDWDRFEAFRSLLEEHGIQPLIGVVPDNQDDNLIRGREKKEFWEYVKRLQQSGWAVALHGYRHVYTQKKGGLFPLNHFSEFAGVPYGQQKEMLEEGRKILESHGIVTDIFMAPAHSYDRNTLKALAQTGFRRVTDGFGTRPYRWRGMIFYPISFWMKNSLKNNLKNNPKNNSKKKEEFTTLVVHANTMDGDDLERYRRILERQEVISYGEYLAQPPEERGILGRLAEYWMAVAKHLLVKFL